MFEASCAHRNEEQMVCGGCLKVSYCGVECAQKDWVTGHAFKCIRGLDKWGRPPRHHGKELPASQSRLQGKKKPSVEQWDAHYYRMYGSESVQDEPNDDLNQYDESSSSSEESFYESDGNGRRLTPQTEGQTAAKRFRGAEKNHEGQTAGVRYRGVRPSKARRSLLFESDSESVAPTQGVPSRDESY